ncbi:MAG: hypothetical protein ACLFVO_23295 [Chloroflexaceae bacterium]
MSEHRETANAAMDQAIPRLAGDIAFGRAEETSLFTNMLYVVQHVCEQE